MDEQATRTTGAGSAWPVVVSAVSWLLTAGLLLVAWSGLQPAPTTDEATLGTLRAEAGDLAGSGPPYPLFLLVVVAVLLVAAAGVLALRFRVARYPAVLLAVAAVVLLALAARWETVPVMILLVTGTVPLLTPAALRRLR